MTCDITPIMELLDQEAKAILLGKYDLLDDIAFQKERLLEELDPETPKKDLRRLSDRLNHNLTLTESALRAIKDVHQEMQEAEAARRSLSSYGPDGTGKTISSPKRGPIRRA